jgi:hypothetical protein
VILLLNGDVPNNLYTYIYICIYIRSIQRDKFTKRCRFVRKPSISGTSIGTALPKGAGFLARHLLENKP